MGFIDRLLDAWHALTGDATRSFTPGEGVVTRSDATFGAESRYSPTMYGDYIVMSNGVYACSTLRADLISSLPIRLYKYKTPNTKAEVTSGSCRTLLNKVNPFWTWNRLIQMTELSMCLWGKCYWFLERGANGTGEPKEIWWVRPDRVKVFPDPVNYVSHFEYIPRQGGPNLSFATSETIWLRYPNPLDEFDGLSPMAAARLGADYATTAMQSNQNLFRNGLQIGGIMAPKSGSGETFSKEQADELSEDLERRFKGVDKAHRWAILRFEAQVSQMDKVTPREAEFAKGMQLSLEEICRAYKVPLDLMGGQRTYANFDASMEAMWVHGVQPAGRFYSSELEEQLLPMFPNQADTIQFDYGNISVLQEDRGRVVDSVQHLWEMGVPLNALLKEFLPALLPPETGKYDWGDVGMVTSMVVPAALAAQGATLSNTTGAPAPEAPPPPTPTTSPNEDLNPSGGKASYLPSRTVEYGSNLHAQIWNRFVRDADPYEREFGKRIATLFKRQKDSVLSKLHAAERGQRDASEVAANPFDMAQWIKAFRTDMRLLLLALLLDVGQQALDDIQSAITFDSSAADVARWVEQNANRFAREVNQTTWDLLHATLLAGIQAEEDGSALLARIEELYGERMAAANAVISRSEVTRAMNAAMLLAWEQSGQVEGKVWVTMMDGRVRDSHRELHGTTLPLLQRFDVNGCLALAPGQTGCADEDANCRCTLYPVLHVATHTAPDNTESLQRIAMLLRAAGTDTHDLEAIAGQLQKIEFSTNGHGGKQ